MQLSEGANTHVVLTIGELPEPLPSWSFSSKQTASGSQAPPAGVSQPRSSLLLDHRHDSHTINMNHAS